MNSQKRLALRTYRYLLNFCSKELGYEFFDWRSLKDLKLKNYEKMSYLDRKNFIMNLKQKDLGAFAANTVRYCYKNNKDLKDQKIINQCIDYSFHVIRNPYLFYKYEKGYLIDMYIEP